ncbi:MAG: hypothetical protein LKCHEGNO_03526 [Burkholderiaceae bacterium]|nr:hypothetical protein [Burkholderiaceae bacterium]
MKPVNGMKPVNEATNQPALGRRKLLGAAGTTGALAAAATLLARRQDEPAVETKTAAPAKGGGYRLSEHVFRYYETTKV